MDYETQKQALLKLARNAFETASTMREEQRIEVYLHNGEAKSSDVLEESEEIIYGPDRVLCYQIFGHDFLEEEIKTWIDYARVLPQPIEGVAMPEPTDIETSIRELITELSQRSGMPAADVSSFEVFANLPMDLLGSIEQQIIEYWWSAKEEENGKKLALEQILEAIGNYNEPQN